jgi:hypothetical protein
LIEQFTNVLALYKKLEKPQQKQLEAREEMIRCEIMKTMALPGGF